MIAKAPSTGHIVTDRGGIIENRHLVHVAIVDSHGDLLYATGDPTRLTLARSAAKPVQALAVLETGGCEKFGFDDADLALMCASHNSETRHIERVRAMLAKVGAKEDDLRCGGHPALSERVNREWIKADYVPTAVCNNCSGKHAGMFAAASALGVGVEGYHLPAHPVQRKVRQVMEELCGVDGVDGDEHLVRWAVDGCNLPAPACSLDALARIYAFFAASVDFEGGDDNPEDPDAGGKNASNLRRRQAAARVFSAMVRYPELVGGEGRFCTGLMRASDGALIGKVGADGCYAIGVRASEQTKRLGSDGGLGIAVKIEDGNIDILYAAVVEILMRLNIGTAKMRDALSPFHRQKTLNTAGVLTGGVTYDFDIRDMQNCVRFG